MNIFTKIRTPYLIALGLALIIGSSFSFNNFPTPGKDLAAIINSFYYTPPYITNLTAQTSNTGITLKWNNLSSNVQSSLLNGRIITYSYVIAKSVDNRTWQSLAEISIATTTYTDTDTDSSKSPTGYFYYKIYGKYTSYPYVETTCNPAPTDNDSGYPSPSGSESPSPSGSSSPSPSPSTTYALTSSGSNGNLNDCQSYSYTYYNGNSGYLTTSQTVSSIGTPSNIAYIETFNMLKNMLVAMYGQPMKILLDTNFQQATPTNVSLLQQIQENLIGHEALAASCPTITSAQALSGLMAVLENNFSDIDSNNDGTITNAEMQAYINSQLLSSYNNAPSIVKVFINDMASHINNHTPYPIIPGIDGVIVPPWKQAFNGILSSEDSLTAFINQFFGGSISRQKIYNMLDAMDGNNDGCITQAEFNNWLSKQPQQIQDAINKLTSQANQILATMCQIGNSLHITIPPPFPSGPELPTDASGNECIYTDSKYKPSPSPTPSASASPAPSGTYSPSPTDTYTPSPS